MSREQTFQEQWEAAMREADEYSDFEQLGRLAHGAYREAQASSVIDAEAEGRTQERLRGYVEKRYGNQIRAMSPAEVEHLDSIPLEDALGELEAARGESPLTAEDRAAATASRKAQLARESAEAWKGVRASIDDQIRGHSATPPGEEIVEDRPLGPQVEVMNDGTEEAA
jgi:hypothetical protein